jgi:hypothetical protein
MHAQTLAATHQAMISAWMQIRWIDKPNLRQQHKVYVDVALAGAAVALAGATVSAAAFPTSQCADTI